MSEVCEACTGPVGFCWHADDAIWNAVQGEPGWQSSAGELAYLGAPGILCLGCFVVKAEERGVAVHIRVVAEADYQAHHAIENAESWGDDGRYWRENGRDDLPAARAYATREMGRLWRATFTERENALIRSDLTEEKTT